ncbi:MAG: tetratricopeptide repeat protein [Verrucomicrobiales bacterium]|nr:tetratricopeptide repeat protein [Verrucomicrobiales bacterium]
MAHRFFPLLSLTLALVATGGGAQETPVEATTAAHSLADIEALIARGEHAEAAKAIAQARAAAGNDAAAASRLLNLEGVLHTARGDAQKAAASFAASLATAPDGPLRTTLAYNAALAALQGGDIASYDRLAGIVQTNAGAGSPLIADLALERGLIEAARADTAAFDSLETFLRRFPDHSRAAHAEISLAELYLTQVPPQPTASREHLDSARERPLTLAQREWLDHVAIWTEIATPDSSTVAERAERFLADWPQSRHRPTILMVLGESLYRAGQFTEAAGHFEQLATESPDSPLAQPALFFAGKATSQTHDAASQLRARAFWERVVAAAGPLSPAAQHEIGLLELENDRFDAAVAAFAAIEALPTASPELKIAARADRGEALYAQATATGVDPERLAAAIDTFAAIERDPQAEKWWRLQAAVRHGKCLEALGRNDEALALYSSIVQDSPPAGPAAAVPVAEFDWFFRAGLAAIRLLQREEKWTQAIAIADRVAVSGGPRATEAARIGESLRLRHFIWEDPAG